MLLRLLALARVPVELAEAEVAVGDKGAHDRICRECEGDVQASAIRSSICRASAGAMRLARSLGLRNVESTVSISVLAA